MHNTRNSVYSQLLRFDLICEANRIQLLLTKANQHWATGRMELQSQTIKETTAKQFLCFSRVQPRTQVAHFMAANKFTSRIKAPGGLAPNE
jgi:hypothetical protein